MSFAVGMMMGRVSAEAEAPKALYTITSSQRYEDYSYVVGAYTSEERMREALERFKAEALRPDPDGFNLYWTVLSVDKFDAETGEPIKEPFERHEFWRAWEHAPETTEDEEEL